MCTAIQAWERGEKTSSRREDIINNRSTFQLPGEIPAVTLIQYTAVGWYMLMQNLDIAQRIKHMFLWLLTLKSKCWKVPCSKLNIAATRNLQQWHSLQNSLVDYMIWSPKEFLLPHKLQVWMIFKIVVILEFLQLRFVDNYSS